MRVPATALLVCLVALAACAEAPDASEQASAKPTFLGLESCVDCHDAETRAWRGSHHDLAMQPATEQAVIADFDDASFEYAGITSTFSRRGDEFWVRTDGPDGELTDFRIAYTFGIFPLQQFLIEFAGGRLQALNVCWDARPREEGGQRWFHLYPEDGEAGIVDHTDVLHWTGIYQNWNFMCAECHSTNVERGYDVATDSYDTTFSEIDVSCEACHGPGSNHVVWAQAKEEAEQAGREYQGDANLGLVVRLKDPNPGEWVFRGQKPTAAREVMRATRTQIESCGRCHARRGTTQDDYHHGHLLADEYRVSLLTPELYYADGHILEEVYVYGSFLQSKMYSFGVVCSDCHEVHSLRFETPGNAVCAKCHRAEAFDTREHHFHDPAREGASCAGCHMPPRTYMGVDSRNDHSFRVPRPDLSLAIGTPNACSYCHADKGFEWAAAQVDEWYPGGRQGSRHWGEAIHAGRERLPGAERMLLQVANDKAVPGIARATALATLPGNSTASALPSIESALADPDPLVRQGAIAASGALDPALRSRLLTPLLSDGVRSVRLEATQALATLPPDALSAETRKALVPALAEHRASLMASADRPESWLNLGVIEATRGELDQAESAYRKAIQIEPRIPMAYLNLADLYRQRGDDTAAIEILRRGQSQVAESADLHYAIGLALVRQKRYEEALAELQTAVELTEDAPEYAYVYAVALHSTGSSDEALVVLESALERWPADRTLLTGLLTISLETGERERAVRAAGLLEELWLGHPEVEGLLRQVGPALRSGG